MAKTMRAKGRLRHRSKFFLIIVLALGITNGFSQNCDVDFPGTAVRNFSATCGGSSVANLTLGKDINIGDGDVFTFNAPSVINVFGNFMVDAQGSGKIIIPAGVTVNVYGNLKLDPKNSGCRSSNPCTFEIEVQGTLNLLDDLDNSLINLIWSGVGEVNVVDDFKNSSNGCMACDATVCPAFDVKPWNCDDDGVGCPDSDFCATILNTCTNDNIDPVIINCPADQIINITGSGCTQIANWSPPTATDNCSLSSLIPSHPPGSSFGKGTTVVTYTATDASGNTSTCSFNITIVDTIVPTITGCMNITVSANASCEAVVNWTPPDYSDNCTGTVLTSTRTPGSIFIKGTTVVTYTATDAAGNTVICSFNVTVVDNTPPILSACPGNKTVSADASCQAVVSWVPPSYSDNCSGTILSSTKSPGNTFNTGTTLVTYTATDAAGNTATCSFNVTVLDDAPPVFSGCPSNRTVNANASCQAVVNWTPPTVSGNCPGTTISVDKPPGSVFELGTTRVTYTARSASGQTATCSFDIVVVDKLPPVVTSLTTIRATVGSDCRSNVSWPIPTAVDCSDFQMESTHNPGDEFSFGSTNVTYTLTDEMGNTSDYTFQVVVENPVSPVISDCPDDIAIEADEFGFATANWIEPTAEVVCGQLSLTGSHSPGYRFPKGVTEVVYTASDELKNKSFCNFKVIVSPPKIIVDIAKVVTPDGNGINDHLKILNIEKYKKNGIVIVDRWGSTIFKANGYDNDKITWDGTNQSGGLAPTGTYFFTMFIQYGEQSVQQTGFIELIR